jgi:hypothetical protein
VVKRGNIIFHIFLECLKLLLKFKPFIEDIGIVRKSKSLNLQFRKSKRFRENLENILPLRIQEKLYVRKIRVSWNNFKSDNQILRYY